MEDDCADRGIPLPNVTSKILVTVIEYCKKHVEASNPDEKHSEDDLNAWDADFIKVDQVATSEPGGITQRIGAYKV